MHITKSELRIMVGLMEWSSDFITLHALKPKEYNKARLIRRLAQKIKRRNAEILRDNNISPKGK